MTDIVTTVESERPQKATTADLTHIAETLARAFFADPVVSWCYPDASRRRDILPGLFRVIVDAYVGHGGIFTTSTNVAAAVWVPPGTEVDEEQLGLELGRVSGEYAERLRVLLELLDAHHPREAPHQYLFLLGTRPEWQGQGIGSRLMRPVLADCDRNGTPAYLEASSERNKRLYERHGFAVTEIIQLPEGPNLWCMWRNGRREGAAAQPRSTVDSRRLGDPLT